MNEAQRSEESKLTDLLGVEYPARLRLFIGFIGIAIASLFDSKNAAELLALGLNEKSKLEKKRYYDNKP